MLLRMQTTRDKDHLSTAVDTNDHMRQSNTVEGKVGHRAIGQGTRTQSSLFLECKKHFTTF